MPSAANRQSVSLLPIFKSSEGQVVAGDYARNLLSGKRQQARRVPNDRRQIAERSYGAGSASAVQHASYASQEGERTVSTNAASAIESTSESEQRVLRSSTFEVPATLRQRLLSESAAPRADADDRIRAAAGKPCRENRANSAVSSAILRRGRRGVLRRCHGQLIENF